MSISPLSRVRGLERLIWLKYSVVKKQNTYYLELNAGKSTHPMKKAPDKSCWELNFV